MITKHACRWSTETHYCARQQCAHGLSVEMHSCTRQQDALQGIKEYSLWLCLDTEGELNMWMITWHAQQTLVQLLDTKGRMRNITICDTTIGGKLRDCPKCWGKPLRGTGYNYRGLASYPNVTILNMRFITWTETSWTHIKRNMVHMMCDGSRTRSCWVATRHASHHGVTVFNTKPFGNRYTSSITNVKKQGHRRGQTRSQEWNGTKEN